MSPALRAASQPQGAVAAKHLSNHAVITSVGCRSADFTAAALKESAQSPACSHTALQLPLMAETEESEPSTPTTRRRKPYGLLHVHCVDVLLDRGCLRTAETVRLQLGYGAQRQGCAGAVERDDDGAGRAYLRRQAAVFEVKASKHAPRCITVAVAGDEGHPEAVGTLDVTRLLESESHFLDERIVLEPRGATVRVAVSYTHLTLPTKRIV